MKRQLPASFRHEADVVAIGASAGGIDALFTLLEGLPADYPLPLITVLHLPEGHDSQLAEVFGRRLALPAGAGGAGPRPGRARNSLLRTARLPFASGP
jgi:two-component system chemotaxis response regulator CheB